MIDNRSAVHTIERAHDDQPFCECGRHTTLSERSGGVWLLCSSLMAEPTGRLGRLVSALTSPWHVRRLVFDLRPSVD